jgi:dTDP-L-rhamnose 4-epimerase
VTTERASYINAVEMTGDPTRGAVEVKPLVLVTGGAGFIGSHIVEQLLERGYRVRVLDSLVEQVHGPLGPRYVSKEADFIRGNVNDVDVLRRALKDVSVIIHDAAEVGVGQSMYEIVRYVAGNTVATAVLLELLANEPHQVQKMIVASSMSIYGEGAYCCPCDGTVYPRLRPSDQLERREWRMRCPHCAEEVQPIPTPEDKPLFPTSVYAITKLDQELLCLAVGAAYDIPVVALRYFNTYGPRQSLSNPYTGAAAIFASRLLNGRAPVIFEDGHQRRDFVHVSDIARANVLALESVAANGQVLNIGTGRPLSILDVATTLARLLDSPMEPEIVGKFRAGDIRDCYADISRSRELIGYEPKVPFENGMAELATWLSGQHADDRVAVATAELEKRGLTR